jgi:predicted DNA-binding transcriptional regulator AlpA
MSISKSKSPAGNAVVEDVLTPDETCQILKISRVSLWRMVRDKRVPVLRLSQRLKRFLRSDVLALKGDK